MTAEKKLQKDQKEQTMQEQQVAQAEQEEQVGTGEIEGLKRKEISIWDEMEKILGFPADRTVSGMWRFRLCDNVREKSPLYAFLDPEVILDEHDEPINPFAPSTFTKTCEMLEEMNLFYGLEKCSKGLRWCVAFESNEDAELRLRICEPKDATHVIIPYNREEYGPYRLTDDVRFRDQIRVLEDSEKSWVLIPLGFVSVVFDMDVDTDYLTKMPEYHTAKTIDELVDIVLEARMEKRAQYWRGVAQKEYEEKLRRIVQRRMEIEKKQAAKERLRPEIERLRNRLLIFGQEWTRLIEEIQVEDETITLLKGWKESLKPDGGDYKFSWMDELYAYTEENVAFVAACVDAVAAQKEAMMKLGKAQEQMATVAIDEFDMGYSIWGANNTSIDGCYPMMQRQGKELRVIICGRKATVKANGCKIAEYDEDFDLEQFRAFLSTVAAQYPISIFDIIRARWPF